MNPPPDCLPPDRQGSTVEHAPSSRPGHEFANSTATPLAAPASNRTSPGQLLALDCLLLLETVSTRPNESPPVAGYVTRLPSGVAVSIFPSLGLADPDSGPDHQ